MNRTERNEKLSVKRPSDRGRIIRLLYLGGNRNHKGHDDDGGREDQVLICLRHRFGERNLIRQERETSLDNDSEQSQLVIVKYYK